MCILVGTWVNVYVGTPINKNEIMVTGETISMLASQFGFLLDDYVVVDNVTNTIQSHQ